MEIILASSSPRRKELLSKIVKSYRIIPSSFDEEKLKRKIKKQYKRSRRACKRIILRKSNRSSRKSISK